MGAKGRGKTSAAPPPPDVPAGHATDQELFDLECDGEAPNPPVSPVYIAARRRIYNLGREHGRLEAERIAAGLRP